LVGGLGATSSGSTSTTTGTSGSIYVPRKKSNVVMLSPYSGIINPSSSTGVTKYNNFIKFPYNKRIDCAVGNRNLIFAGLAKKAMQYSLAILWVPTSSTGKMAGAPLTINSISLANVNCKRLGPDLGYRSMDIVDYILLPFVFLFQMTFTFKTSILPFLVKYFHHTCL
jgi:hypothetical protein